jgi:hypothetical protein
MSLLTREDALQENRAETGEPTLALPSQDERKTLLSEVSKSAKVWGALISLGVLIPIFWHRNVVECDLGSHVYNAWLATLIEKGQAPGLYLARQWDNVLFDVMLESMGKIIGWNAAERVALSISVLVFFWGTLALMKAMAGRPSWFLIPAVAMVTYGWTFQIGFSNYYLSLGLAFWAIALLWKGKSRYQRLIGLALLPLALFAQSLGFLFALGALFYLKIRELLPGFWKILAPLVTAATIALAREYLGAHYQVKWASALPLFIMNGLNGVDQLVFNPEYRDLARAVFLLGLSFLVFEFFHRWYRTKSAKSLATLAIPLELYGIALVAIAALPDAIKFSWHAGWVSYLLMRFSLIAAVLSLCVLACTRFPKIQFVAFAIIAGVFFGRLYRDTQVLSEMQTQAYQLVDTLPPNQRVIGSIWSFPGSRFYFMERMVDRACVEKCFSYNNYEPATEWFRIRANPGNPIVATSLQEIELMENGSYVLQSTNFPMYGIYQCDGSLTKLCMRQLQAGEQNVGFQSR